MERRRKSLSLATLLVLFVGLSPMKLGAQTSNAGALTGHVHGPAGVSVPGATVVLTNPQTGERKETWTDDAGNYAFNGLPPGNYKLEVSLVGFHNDVREPIPISEGKALKVNVALTINTPVLANASGNRPSGQRLPQNLQNLPGQVQGALGAQGLDQSLMAGMNGNGGGVRFSGEQAAASGGQSEAPAETDTSASASESVLLTGGEGISASAPGGGQGRGQRFQQMRDLFMMQGQGAPGFGGGGQVVAGRAVAARGRWRIRWWRRRIRRRGIWRWGFRRRRLWGWGRELGGRPRQSESAARQHHGELHQFGL